jgi:alpha-L-fucosidase 2
MKSTIILTLFLSTFQAVISQAEQDEQLINPPGHGFFSRVPATKWEESMLTGNGVIGALVFGKPLDERIILSHEKLFMPEYPPHQAPPLHKYLKEIRQLTLKGQGGKAADLLVRAGEEVGIDDMIWTDPLIPACQLEIKSLAKQKVTDYIRAVNYETGEAISAWKMGSVIHQRAIFFSRADDIGVMRISAARPASLNYEFRLSQLPIPEDEDVKTLISQVRYRTSSDRLHYSSMFKKQWAGSLKGYHVSARLINSGGRLERREDCLRVRDADEITLLLGIKLSYTLPLKSAAPLVDLSDTTYTSLLAAHTKIHTPLFKRFSLRIAADNESPRSAAELLASSSVGNLSAELINQLCEAARYTLVSSAGEIPPTLQGIWGGAWRPAWSSDFTLNGNVPSAIACGLNTNLPELTESYLNMMWSMMADFKDNAQDLYHAPGIFVPSRVSSSGKTYHYGYEYPHLLWYAGNAWTAQFFYDYWQYTGDETFLKERAIPFMLAAIKFYEFILTRAADGHLMFLPSYSPELGPRGHHPLAINATMDVAALKQLLRNLLNLVKQGRLDTAKAKVWQTMLQELPPYQIDKQGDLKEWLWTGLENNNRHRHASHLYPLFYELDPEFTQNPELIQAAKTAIENRLKYRRPRNGAEMAFGLAQLGLAAAHINDSAHAYECVDWLCNSYWSPALSSYHDPGEIFNVDICGGLPAVVTEMLIQSSAQSIDLLPALPRQWPAGLVAGVLTRCGVTLELEWKDHQPSRIKLRAQRKTAFKLKFQDREKFLSLDQGQVVLVDSI